MMGAIVRRLQSQEREIERRTITQNKDRERDGEKNAASDIELFGYLIGCGRNH